MIGIATHRCALPITLGAGVTIALLLLMQALIHVDMVDVDEPAPAPAIDFVRVIETPDVEVKDEIEPPPPVAAPPQVRLRTVEFTGGGGGVPVDPVAPLPPGPGPVIPATATAVPIVEPAPQYPQRCASRGIEGHVVVRFDIDQIGAPMNAEVLEAEPGGCFERAALAAIARYRYRPAMDGGRPVVMRGLLKRISFRLDG